jgi:hypothetical protein
MASRPSGIHPRSRRRKLRQPAELPPHNRKLRTLGETQRLSANPQMYARLGCTATVDKLGQSELKAAVVGLSLTGRRAAGEIGGGSVAPDPG